MVNYSEPCGCRHCVASCGVCRTINRPGAKKKVLERVGGGMVVATIIAGTVVMVRKRMGRREVASVIIPFCAYLFRLGGLTHLSKEALQL